MKVRTRQALVIAPALLALSGGTMVAANADDDTSTAVSSAERQKKRGYKFLSRSSGYRYIARWNPCKKIHYKVNARKARRKGALKDVKKAMRRVRRVSGLKFKYIGRTKKTPKPRATRPYKGKLDMVVAWAPPKKRKVLRGLGGYAGGAWKRVSKRYGKFTRGFVLLNSKYRYKYPRGFGKGPRRGYGTRGQLLMHEIGHAVGLDHVRSRKQIMYKHTYRRKAKWGKGDKRGLRKVGRPAGCLRGRPTGKVAQSPTRVAGEGIGIALAGRE